ncbi:MAG: hypothetical protein K0U72_02560 [Gammaproteobacteria bacterium]|nr:hypothetical protein [Gammaproteobacteria bacterium]
MFSKYQKQGAPPWQRKLVLLIASLFAATLLMFMVWAVILSMQWFQVDRCLDRGGSYNYDSGECRDSIESDD